MLCTAWPAHVAWCLAFSNLIFKTPPTYSLIELSLNDLDEERFNASHGHTQQSIYNDDYMMLESA